MASSKWFFPCYPKGFNICLPKKQNKTNLSEVEKFRNKTNRTNYYLRNFRRVADSASIVQWELKKS